jgi:thiosulfate dehydrogenase
MKYLRSNWFISLVVIAIIVILISELLLNHYRKKNPAKNVSLEKSLVPAISSITDPLEKEQIIYGRDLIANTARYLGPHGSVAQITNGLNCQNCHLDAGARMYASNFLGVASTYPKFRERSGKIESIEFRVNECLERSLNGKAIDSSSKEMRAMVSYLKWLGKNVHKNQKVDGVGAIEIAYINRPADTLKGKQVYLSRCVTCHGKTGDGVLSSDSAGYLYPPLWGNNAYAVSAGMYRLSKLSSYVRNNMPPGATYHKPQLMDEEAWDVAAFINSQPHPKKMFAYDWPVLSTKPVDYPFGPYTDTFDENQHKYGPFLPIKKARER